MKKRILALCLALSLPLFAEPKPFLVAETSSIDKLQSFVTSISAQIGNPGLALGFVGLGNVLGSPGFLGIDRTKPVRVLFLSKEDVLQAKPIVILPLSSTDGAEYLKSLGAHLTLGESANNFSTYTNKGGSGKIRYHFVDGYALFSEQSLVDDADLEAVGASLKQNLDAYSIQGLPGTIRIQANMSFLMPFVEKSAREYLEAIDEENTELRQSSRTAVNSLIDRLKEISHLAISLDATDALGVTYGFRADVLPESSLEKSVASCTLPSERLLSFLGGAPELASTDAILLHLMASQVPLVNTLLDAVIALTDDKEKQDEFRKTVDILKPVLDHLPSATATVLRYDSEGRPFLYVAQEGMTEEGFKKLLEASEAQGSEVQTRTAQGTTIHVIPVPVPEEMKDFFWTYLNKNDYCSESFYRDGVVFTTTGPAGTIDTLLAEPFPKETLPCEPLKEIFPDIPSMENMGTRITLDVCSIIHKLGLYHNRTTETEEDKIPAASLESLANAKGRVGALYAVKDRSLVFMARVTPGFFKSINSIQSILEAFRTDSEDDEDLLEPDEDASDEELDALLKEAEKLQ